MNYTRALMQYQNRRPDRQSLWIGDDFAGMFPPEMFKEFVVPYWEMIYGGMGSAVRELHCELLRPDHLDFLIGLKIDSYDPGVNGYLEPEILRERCRVSYMLRIRPAWVQQQSAGELVRLYRHFATFDPTFITFGLDRLADEHKIAELLKTASEME